MNGEEADLTSIADQNHKPTLFDVNNILDANVVGEEETRLGLFVSWILARKYVVITGSSRSGKTHIKEQVRKLIEDQCYQLQTGSDKSMWYEAEKIQNHFYVDVPELNQIPKGFEEILKRWGEDKPASYKVVTHDLQTGRRINEEKKLPYRPFVFAIADENEMKIPKELRYRLIEMRCDGSEAQTRKILKWQAQISKNPKLKKSINQEELKIIKNHLTTMPPFKKYFYINPMADIVQQRTPAMFTDARTAHQIFKDIISGIQRYHWKESHITEQKEYSKPLIFISPQTILQAYIILGKIFLNSSLKCNDVQRRILDIIKNSRTYAEASTISKELKRQGRSISKSMAKKHLDELTEMNYLDKKENGRITYYEITEDFQKQALHIKGETLIQEAEKNMKEQFPKHWTEYNKIYLSKPEFIHPFTGEILNLHTYETNYNETRNKNMENLDNYKPTNLTAEEAKEDQERFAGADMTEDMEEETIPDSDIIMFIQEKGEAGYDTNEFVEKYGEDTLSRLKEKGEVFLPNPNTIKILE